MNPLDQVDQLVLLVFTVIIFAVLLFSTWKDENPAHFEQLMEEVKQL